MLQSCHCQSQGQTLAATSRFEQRRRRRWQLETPTSKVLHKYVVGLGTLIVHEHTQILCFTIPWRVVKSPISNLGDEER